MIERYKPKATYFAYVHARPDTVDAYGIFHVGKGNLKRTTEFNDRNADYKKVVKEIGKENVLIGRLECSSEQTAFELERNLIKRLRIMGVDLTNETEGGQGTFNPSPKLRAKLQPNWDESKERTTQLNKERIWTPKSRALVARQSQAFFTNMGWITDGIEERRFDLNDPIPNGWELGRLLMKDESKAKVSASLIGNQRTKGYRWITDGISNKLIGPEELPPEGWRFGHFSPWMLGNKSPRTRGKRWITNGVINKMISSNETLPQYWWFGLKK